MSTQVPQETNNSAITPTLYMALEMSKKFWKLAFSDGDIFFKVFCPGILCYDKLRHLNNCVRL